MTGVKSLNLDGSVNALTIDVEDWFQVANLRSIIDYDDWDNCESRILYSIEKVLRILSNASVRATFFILGWIAERKPAVVKAIQKEGHEIGTHGYAHKCVFEFTPDDFKRDFVRSIEILEQITGQNVLGYRAPNYSINPKTVWAWEIMAEQGIKYDASIYPVKHDRYGFPVAPRFPFILNLKEYGNLIEVPASTIRLFGNNFPIAGGAYFRLFPYKFIHSAIHKLNKQSKPAIIYLHPWELDPYQPRVNVNFFSKFKHYGNLALTEYKLSALLNDFQFTSLNRLLNLT